MSTMEQVERVAAAICDADTADGAIKWARLFGGGKWRWRAMAEAALTAALPAPGVEAPGDWVMVPRVPTDEMMRAGMTAHSSQFLSNNVRDAWSDMLDAAPSAPAEISQAQAQAMREALLSRCSVLLGDAANEFHYQAHSSGDPADPANMDGAAVLYRETRQLLGEIEAALPLEPPR